MRQPFLLIILCLTMCKTAPESPPTLDQAVFVQVYCDVVVQGNSIPQQLRSAFADSILTENNVSRGMFEQTVHYYSQDPERWQVVFKLISKELENRITQNNPTSRKTEQSQAPVSKNSQKLK